MNRCISLCPQQYMGNGLGDLIGAGTDLSSGQAGFTLNTLSSSCNPCRNLGVPSPLSSSIWWCIRCVVKDSAHCWSVIDHAFLTLQKGGFTCNPTTCVGSWNQDCLYRYLGHKNTQCEIQCLHLVNLWLGPPANPFQHLSWNVLNSWLLIICSCHVSWEWMNE